MNRETIVRVIKQMEEESFRLKESTKRPNGSLGISKRAVALRNMAYKMDNWATDLRTSIIEPL